VGGPATLALAALPTAHTMNFLLLDSLKNVQSPEFLGNGSTTYTTVLILLKIERFETLRFLSQWWHDFTIVVKRT